MIRSISSDLLLRRAYRATGGQDVRGAIRDLTLQAFRSRPLSVQHIAIVARAVGEGIESTSLLPATPVHETSRGAWAGLEDALGQALLAVELAVREAAEESSRFAAAEREELLAQVAQMEHSLGSGWRCYRAMPASLRKRVASATTLLRCVATNASRAGAAQAGESAPEDNDILPLVASGVMVGLAAGYRVNAPGKSK